MAEIAGVDTDGVSRGGHWTVTEWINGGELGYRCSNSTGE